LRAEVKRCALTCAMARDRRTTGQLRARKGGHHFGAAEIDVLAPDVSTRLGAVGERQGDVLSDGKRVKVDHVDAKKLAERLRVAAEMDVVRGIDYATEKRHDQHAARLDESHHIRSRFVSDQVGV